MMAGGPAAVHRIDSKRCQASCRGLRLPHDVPLHVISQAAYQPAPALVLSTFPAISVSSKCRLPKAHLHCQAAPSQRKTCSQAYHRPAVACCDSYRALLQIDRCFGFDTAVEEAQRALLAAKVEASSAYRGIGLVRLMGRSSGYIAMNASMASGVPACNARSRSLRGSSMRGCLQGYGWKRS